MAKYIPHKGSTGRLPTDDNHLNYKWLEPGCNILFSVARQGNGLSCHFTSDKPGMKKIDNAIDDFIYFAFNAFPWCTMLIAKVKLDIVRRLVLSHGFKRVIDYGKNTVYVRRRQWEA